MFIFSYILIHFSYMNVTYKLHSRIVNRFLFHSGAKVLKIVPGNTNRIAFSLWGQPNGVALDPGKDNNAWRRRTRLTSSKTDRLQQELSGSRVMWEKEQREMVPNTVTCEFGVVRLVRLHNFLHRPAREEKFFLLSLAKEYFYFRMQMRRQHNLYTYSSYNEDRTNSRE